ncbi:MAG TPA: FAD-dependent monooxygenase [Caulobacteraceae bacterium]|jgi:2-polyprenyl-6-methoxyphenol hydroxylase-like FAD-dependent oxidoreductase
MVAGAACEGLNVAVAGGGPAGLAAALLLRSIGCRVILFERFETPRPLGSGLMIQPTGLAVLDRLGLADRLRERASVIDRLFGKAAGSDRTVLDVRYKSIGPVRGFGVHRATLFQLLFDAAKAAGVEIRTGRTITCEVADDGRRLTFADGLNEGPYDLLVDALGHASPLAPPNGRVLPFGALWASLDWPAAAGFDAGALEQRYRRASAMVGVMPIGRPPGAARPQAAFFWSLRADQYEAWRAAGLAPWKAEVLDFWPATAPLLDQVLEPEQLTFARYAHRTLPRPVASRLVHIGDAWRSSSPQLGQGANIALLDAYALALALRREAYVETALRLFTRLRRRHAHLYQLMSAAFTPVYQSDSRLLPVLRDRLAGPLSKIWPSTAILASMVAGLIGDPLTPLELRGRKGSDLVSRAAELSAATAEIGPV